MSYCRWSSDDFGSDLYIYEAADGHVVHVANRRYVFPEGALPPPITLAVGDPGWAEAWANRGIEVQAVVETAALEQIDLPMAGESFYGLTAEEAADKTEELIALGYHVPAGVVEALREDDEDGA